MLSIRLLRVGKKHQPSYKIVVVDQRRSPKSGKFIEQLGFYNPSTKERGINKERTQYWLSQGAQASDTVHNFLIREGVIEGKKISVHSTKKRKKEEVKEAPAAEVSAEKVPEKETVKAETPQEAETKKQETPKEEAKEPEVEPRKETPTEVPEKKSEDSKEKPMQEEKSVKEEEDKNLDTSE